MPTTTFVWDPVNDCVISELDGTGATQAVYTSEPQHYGGVLSQRRGSTSSFLHADALGTTRLLTRTAGATTDTYLFDAWGNPVSSTGSTVNPFRWVGRYGYYTDNATGLLYVRARMYMPTVARWCSVDPLLYRDSLNLFQISHNSVVNRIDPSGLCTVCGIKAVYEGSFAELDNEFVAGQEPFRLGAETWQNIYEDDPVMRSRRLNFGPIHGAGTYTSTNMTDVTINGSMWPTRSIHAIGHLFYLVAYIKSECGNASDCRVVLREDGQTWQWRDVFGRQGDSRWAKIWGSRKVDDLIYRGDAPPQLPIPVGVSEKLSMGDLVNPTPEGCDKAIVMTDMPSQDSHIRIDDPHYGFWGTRQDFVIQTLQITDTQGNVVKNGLFIHSWRIGFVGGAQSNIPLQGGFRIQTPVSLGPPPNAAAPDR